MKGLLGDTAQDKGKASQRKDDTDRPRNLVCPCTLLFIRLQPDMQVAEVRAPLFKSSTTTCKVLAHGLLLSMQLYLTCQIDPANVLLGARTFNECPG